jgi:hypothetical protein
MDFLALVTSGFGGVVDSAKLATIFGVTGIIPHPITNAIESKFRIFAFAGHLLLLGCVTDLAQFYENFLAFLPIQFIKHCTRECFEHVSPPMLCFTIVDSPTIGDCARNVSGSG